MRTLRVSNGTNKTDRKSEVESDERKENEDDDVGANGDETTDDEGGVDTPPPTKEEDDLMEAEEEEQQEEETSNKKKEKEKKEVNNKKKEKEVVNKKKEKEENNKKTEKKENNKKKEKEENNKKKEEAGNKKKREKKDDGEYEVEQIVDMEVVPRRKCPVKFRVRWLGYSEKEDTWLPASNLTCEDLVQDFLEISGRKSEYERAFEAKRKAAEYIAENYRQSARKINRIPYSELDEDEDELIPSGTRTRKVKTKAEKKEISEQPQRKKKKLSSPAAAPKQYKVQEEYEVEKIIEHRVKGSITDYKIRWKGYGPKHDQWMKASELNCPSLVKVYNKQMKDTSKEEDGFEVESIADMREVKGRIEYKVRWKNWGPKHDSWLPEEELDCPDILDKFKEELDKLEKQEDWQVESIVESRVRKGKTEYFVHWVGFEPKFNSWEPADNLKGCQNIVNKYEKQQEEEEEEKKQQEEEEKKKQQEEEEKKQQEEEKEEKPQVKKSTAKKPSKAGRKSRGGRSADASSAEAPSAAASPAASSPAASSPAASRLKSKRNRAAMSYSEFYEQ